MNIQYLSNYRGIAILMVVLAHAVSTLGYLDAGGGYFRYISPALSVGTILFVMVAGVFFVVFPDNGGYFGYLRNKARFVLAPYVVISLPAALLFLFHLRRDHRWLDLDWLYSLNPLEMYAYLLSTGAHLGPLWFIPMIVIFYLLNPFWKYLVRTGYVYPAFLVAMIIGMFVRRSADNSNVLQSSLYFVSPYLLGMCVGLNLGRISGLSRFSAWGLPVAIMLVVFAGQFKGLAWSLPATMLLSVMLLLFCADQLNKRVRLLNMFARLSFYIFFAHGYIIGIFSYLLAQHQYSVFDPLLVVLIFFSTLAICVFAFVPLKLALKNRSKVILAA